VLGYHLQTSHTRFGSLHAFHHISVIVWISGDAASEP